MNETLDHNIDCLKKRYGEKFINRFEAGLSSVTSTLTTNKQILDAAEESASETNQVIYSDDQYAQGLVLIFYGFGQHVKRVIKDLKYRHLKSIIIIEKDTKRLAAAFSLLDCSELISDPNITWCVNAGEYDVYRELRHLFSNLNIMCRVHSIKTISYTPSFYLNGEYYYRVHQRILAAANDSFMSIMATPEDHLRGLMNVLNNATHYESSSWLDELKGKHRNKIGCVVSSGPSLNASLAALKSIRQDCVVVCADSALGVLLKNGIRPDYTACLERVKATHLLFEDLQDYSDIPLLYVPVVYPDTLKSYQGQKICVVSKGTAFSWLMPDVEPIVLGNSVATMALKCLHFMGCQNILFFGQDLAFKRKSTQSHAHGVKEFIQVHGTQKCEQQLANSSNQDDWVEGNNGEKILSWAPYRTFARQIACYVRDLELNALNVIEPEFGMKIENVPQVNPIDIQAVIKKFNIHNEEIKHLDAKKHRLSINDFTQRALQAKEGLKKLSAELMQKYIKGEYFYHENLPSTITDELRTSYIKYLSEVEHFVSGLFENKDFTSLVWPHIYAHHVTSFSKYYAAYVSDDVFDKREKVMFKVIRSWLKEAYLWAQTVYHLFEANDLKNS